MIYSHYGKFNFFSILGCNKHSHTNVFHTPPYLNHIISQHWILLMWNFGNILLFKLLVIFHLHISFFCKIMNFHFSSVRYCQPKVVFQLLAFLVIPRFIFSKFSLYDVFSDFFILWRLLYLTLRFITSILNCINTTMQPSHWHLVKVFITKRRKQTSEHNYSQPLSNRWL